EESARDFEPIVSSVIARSPERWIDQITINRGSRHGVEKNMAVMTADGMIGKVSFVSPSTAKVQLITGFDQLNRVSATVFKKDKSLSSPYLKNQILGKLKKEISLYPLILAVYSQMVCQEERLKKLFQINMGLRKQHMLNYQQIYLI